MGSKVKRVGDEFANLIKDLKKTRYAGKSEVEVTNLIARNMKRKISTKKRKRKRRSWLYNI